MLPSETMIWQPEFTDKTLSRKPGAVQEKTDMPGYTEYVLAEGSFSYGQAVAVITAYRNVFIQDDPGMHFRRVIRNAEGQRRWRCRNSEPDAGKVLNTRLASDGLLRQ